MMRLAAETLIPYDCCVFSNVLEVWGSPEEVLTLMGNCSTYEDKLEQANALPKHQYAYCQKHQKFCHIGKGRPRVSGPPCPDWSSAGLKRGLDGPDLPCTLAGGAKARAAETPVAVVENVRGISGDVIADAYGPEYRWARVQVSPKLVGFEMVSRDRWENYSMFWNMNLKISSH